jgi:hypothetical protein
VSARRRTALIVLGVVLAAVVGHRLFTRIGEGPRPAQPIGSSDLPSTLRRAVLAERDTALDRADLEQAASLNGVLGGEALVRAAATARAWMARRNPETRLFPEGQGSPLWKYDGGASHLFVFLLHAAARLEPSSLPLLGETLAAETALSPPGELCQAVNSTSGARIDETSAERMRASAAYLTGGLLDLYERFGSHPALVAARERLFQLLDTIIARSAHPSRYGPLPGTGAAENGNVLLACSRLSYSAGRPAYAEMAARIADATVTQALPKNGGLPPLAFDYERDRVLDGRVSLGRRGGETIPALAEAYALAISQRETAAWQDRAERWAEPIAAMYETVLSTPLGDDAARDAVLTGALLFTQAARRHGRIEPARLDALDGAVDRAIAALTRTTPAVDERDADALAAALQIAGHRRSLAQALVSWVDAHIGNLLARQRADGTVTADHRDADFIRAALLYAEEKSGGWYVDPWRADVRVGFAEAPSGEATVYVASTAPYAGTLRHDWRRHRLLLRLPWDWPRTHAWPQWFVLDENVSVVRLEGLGRQPSAKELRLGIPLDLPARGSASLRFRVE